MKQDLNQINIHDEYGTPNAILRKAMLDYDILPFIDVCATQLNAKFGMYLTKKQNALIEEWNLDFFMNPPYSEIYQWMERAYQQHLIYKVKALILVYAKTDTKWWHDFVESKAEIHFIKGRIKFLDENNNPTKHSAPYPSCWVIYR